jgi:hypothetical protein
MGIFLDVLIQVGEQDKFAQRGTDTDGQVSNTQLIHLPDTFFSVIDTDKSISDLFIEIFPFLGQGNSPGITDKQRHLKILLETGNGLGDGRLADIKLFGCRRDIFAGGNSVKNII